MSQGALPCQDIAASVTASCLRGWYRKRCRESPPSSCTCCFPVFSQVFSAGRIEERQGSWYTLILFQVIPPWHWLQRFHGFAKRGVFPGEFRASFLILIIDSLWTISDSYLLYETAEDQFCIKRDIGHSMFWSVLLCLHLLAKCILQGLWKKDDRVGQGLPSCLAKWISFGSGTSSFHGTVITLKDRMFCDNPRESSFCHGDNI